MRDCFNSFAMDNETLPGSSDKSPNVAHESDGAPTPARPLSIQPIGKRPATPAPSRDYPSLGYE